MQKKLDKNLRRNQRSRAAPEVNPPRIDWPQILADLKQHGCSLYRVAAALGASWSTVQHWREPTADPRYGYGRALLRLHSRYCGAALTILRHTEAEERAYTSRA